MIFSVTERATAKRCPRQHRLTSKNGRHLGPIISPVYLSTGSLIHSGSQSWILDTERKATYEDHVTVASFNLIEKITANYIKRVGLPPSEAELGTTLDAIGFARTMAHNYEIRWGTPIPEGLVILRPEQKIQVPVPGTEHECERCGGTGYEASPPCSMCGGTGIALHILEGRFDGLLQDAMGHVLILEHKTYNARPKQESLDHNDQFLAYMWLATQLNIGEVMGLAYDGLWRRDRIPRGRTFEDLFLRTTVTRHPNELREFEQMLPRELNMMAANIASPFDQWIDRRWMGCWDCKVEPICTAMSRGEDYESVIRGQFMERDDDVEELDDDGAAAAA